MARSKKWWKKYKEKVIAALILLALMSLLPYAGYQFKANNFTELDISNIIESFGIKMEPVIIEVPQIVEVEKIVYVDKIVYLDKLVYVEKPVYIEKDCDHNIQVIRDTVIQYVVVICDTEVVYVDRPVYVEVPVPYPVPGGAPWKHGHNK